MGDRRIVYHGTSIENAIKIINGSKKKVSKTWRFSGKDNFLYVYDTSKGEPSYLRMRAYKSGCITASKKWQDNYVVILKIEAPIKELYSDNSKGSLHDASALKISKFSTEYIKMVSLRKIERDDCPKILQWTVANPFFIRGRGLKKGLFKASKNCNEDFFGGRGSDHPWEEYTLEQFIEFTKKLTIE